MSSATISTIVKMLESLPPASQEQVAQYLREYIADMQDEERWNESFARKEHQLAAAAARRAKQEIAAGNRSGWMRSGCELRHVALILADISRITMKEVK